MNTIFKFYHQAWPLSRSAAPSSPGARGAQAGAGARPSARCSPPRAVAVALLYPLNAAVSRLRQQDGAVLARRAAARSRGAAPATPRRSTGSSRTRRRGSVVLEATGDPYSRVRAHLVAHRDPDGARLGQPRGPLARRTTRRSRERARRVKRFYTTADPRGAWDIVQKYGVHARRPRRHGARGSPGRRARRELPVPRTRSSIGRHDGLRGRAARDEDPDGARLLPAERVGAHPLRRAPGGGPRRAAATRSRS